MNSKLLFRNQQKKVTPGKKSEGIYETNGAIYKLTCKECAKSNIVTTYIGETVRQLKFRLKEHCKFLDHSILNDPLMLMSQSQPAIHASKTHSSNDVNMWDVLILGKEDSTQRRRVLESMAINNHKPNLNISSGLILVV